MENELTIFIRGFILGSFLTFTVLYCFYITTLKYLVTVNINNTYKEKQQMKELESENR